MRADGTTMTAVGSSRGQGGQRPLSGRLTDRKRWVRSAMLWRSARPEGR
jgi:hypothetical protein